MFQDISCLEEIPIPDSLQPTIFIQNSLIKLVKNECVDKFCRIILESEQYKTKIIVEKLAEELVILSQIRQNRFHLISRICQNLFSESYYKEQLRPLLLRRIFRESSYYLLLCLYNDQIYSQNDIMNLILEQKRSDFAMYFAPEFGLIDTSIMIPKQWVKKVIKHLSDYQANDWALFKEYRTLGWLPNSIVAAIKKDDLDALLDFEVDSRFNINNFIEASPLEPFRLPRVNTYMSLAAIFGSINCFKLFYQSDIPVTDRIMHSAIAGGNYEIVRICARSVCDGFEAAIEYRQNEIMDWLLQNSLCKISSAVCMDWNNLLAALYLSDKTETNEILIKGMNEIYEGKAIAMPEIVSSSSNYF
ncbi:hypothetical protein TVAG_362950 [Trichomonas vaginalis G3]|uniref:DUF3447 domain-containing protein n=1 Tax=Trichomonas vaginalis (strain ATCC PRA-98 / G3) TaxID=412133 RepID=A2G341_TRIV3|nr:protein ubiquitination [Trichomonas vaginalis G3]EAX88421.1 hypothetical protein TVAG_362950 [Trichomonas vaginalis G3]KAI5505344.1 protein ubiquitination [Trichomonas vaginalis G3]|eukprot:XP_001301351.1 hypothetical protein [Trichomonas vaginalis G3]